MESYCVIHFKEKQGKVKILTFLASETEVDFTVTANLKEYVAKQFHVIILENNEVSNFQNVIETTTSASDIACQKIDSYCVIHFKNKPEKGKILNFLAIETEAEYYVTTDLKGFVAKHFGVIITDKVEMRDQATNTIQENEHDNIKKETVDEIVVVIPTSINNPVEQAPIPTIVIESTPLIPEKEIKKEVSTEECAPIDQSSGGDNEYRALEEAVVKDEPEDDIFFDDVDSPIDSNSDTILMEQQPEYSFDDQISREPFVVDHPSPVIDNQQELMNLPLNEHGAVDVVEKSNDHVVAPTINTLPAEQQHPSAPIVPPSPIDINVVDQQVPVVEQQNELTVTTISDEVLERIEDEVVVVVDQEGNVTEMDEDITEETTTMNKDVPSTSSRSRRITRKSGHSMDNRNNEEYTSEKTNVMTDASSSSRWSGTTRKRPRFSMDDDDNEESAFLNEATSKRRSGRIIKKSKYSVQDDSENELENIQETKKKMNKDQGCVSAKNENTADACQKCGTFCPSYGQKLEHVMMHIKLKKYECLVKGCGYKYGYKKDMLRHSKTKHKTNCVNEIKLTREQTEEVSTAMRECFPGMSSHREGTCQVCHQSVGRNSANSSFHRREHALQHIDIMLYKCMEKGCKFESKTKRSMNQHITYSHDKKADGKFQTNKLTKEQEQKIEEMVIKCFPNIDKNREEVDESDG